MKKWTPVDKAKVQEIECALKQLAEEYLISYNEEIKWLESLEQRFEE